MLRQLYIKNFTLIDTLDIQLHPGFSVITGETGAGKSIILGAIGLLLGQRADSKALKQGADKCVIEAHFDLSRYSMEPFFTDNDIEYDANDTIVRRELTAAGKSRAFINDTPVSLQTLKELGEQLVDVHSQHKNLLLRQQDFQLSVVDIIAGDDHHVKDYREAFAAYHKACRQLEQLKADIEQNRQNADFLKFQYNELSEARLTDGEQEELEQKSETMTHAEDIKSALYEADNALSGDETGAVQLLRSAMSALKGIGHVFPAAAELAERMDSTYIELKDVAQEVSSNLENIDFEPSELDAVNARLDRIYDLQKKYHADTIAGLLALQEELRLKLSAIENSDDALDELNAKCQQLKADCQKQADALTKLRTKAARQVEREMQERLVPLGMPNVRFAINVAQTELGRNGQDEVQFLFSANTSTPLQPVAQVASGGEVARVMLSLKAMISGAVKLPTIIFDEIDTGVSGRVAEQMARMMQEMGLADRQVISITHLPQIAALGTSHYKVTKTESADGTISTMTELSQDERVNEIAQMLSGSDITAAAIEHAKELLKQ
ncbi:MAG: DNA repair protein RecN [Prevotella sp.]|nr:DNA repair protein RecN [Prevotella sp.]